MRAPRLILALLATTVVATGLLPAAAAHASTTPSWSTTTAGWNRSSSPVIADVNGDGQNDIVVGGEDGQVRVLNADGQALAGWPKPATINSTSATAIDSSPAVGDLDHDGKNEVVVGAGSLFQTNHNGGIVVYRSDGSVRCRFQTRDTFNEWNGGGPDGYSDGVYSTPAIGDVNGDGYPDIVFGSWDHYIHAINRTCHEIPGFPYFVDDTVWSSPALSDVDHDGRMEIIVGNDQTLGGPDSWQGGEVRALDWQNGAVRELWRRQVGDVVQSSPAIADINGDGKPDVVVGVGNFYHSTDGHRVYAFDAATGATVPGWPQTTGGVTFSSPALGDINGDTRADVVIGSLDGYIQAYNGNGALIFRIHLPNAQTASPIIADMNGDGRNDVGVGTDFDYYVIDGRTHAVTAYHTFKSYGGAAAVGSFGSHGWRLVTAGFDTPNHTATLSSYSIPTPGVTPPWPMFHKTSTHIGAPPSSGGAHPLPPNQCRASTNPAPHESTASGKGYWFVDRNGAIYSFGGAHYLGGLPGIPNTGGAAALTASPGVNGYWILSPTGGVYSFGGARFYGSMGGQHLNAPIIGMSATVSGHGYWLLGRDGGIFSFGDARFYGSMGGQHLNAPIIAMTPTTSGHGYWLLAADGGVFSFGDARFFGSTGAMHLNAPVISMAAGPGGVGYWLLASDGGVFSFHVAFYGSVPGSGLCSIPTSRQIRSSSTGHGYWLLATNGQVFHYGDAKNYGQYTQITGGATDFAILR
ncbi:MAG TPA: FG-GAP-like repeat-containing protein [Acidimicrobiia bacterium]|jgi:hypothetical protein|nr:FG-GAP-like repeat-containing protein [Acidimicrobiia bacterium]